MRARLVLRTDIAERIGSIHYRLSRETAFSGRSSSWFRNFRSRQTEFLPLCPSSVFILASLNPSCRAKSQIVAHCSACSGDPTAAQVCSSINRLFCG